MKMFCEIRAARYCKKNWVLKRLLVNDMLNDFTWNAGE